jgi:hypothetical protein
MSAASSSPIHHVRVDRSMARGGGSRYELRFAGLFNAGRGLAFPCDASGSVDIDSLSDPARTNYFYARTVIGREFHAPVTCVVTDSYNDSAGLKC